MEKDMETTDFFEFRVVRREVGNGRKGRREDRS